MSGMGDHSAPDRVGKLAAAMRALLKFPGSAKAARDVDDALRGCTPSEYDAAFALAADVPASGSPVKLRALTAKGRRPAMVAALVALIAAGLGTYAAAASYDTVSHLAAAKNVALPRLNPIGIDGGLAGVIILDIVATWLDEPIWWLRLAARAFAVGTVAANAAAGWPDITGTGLRVGAPVLFVVITEAGRTLLLRGKKAEERKRKAARRKRRAEERAQRRTDRIPAVRWLLDFRGTWAMWRRMRLWREPSYARAVAMELERLAAMEQLAMEYGAGEWQHKAPADLVWMLTSGVRMTEALARVPELINTEERARKLEAEVRKLRAGREAELAEARAEMQAVIGRLEAGLADARRAAETASEQAEALGRKLDAANRKLGAGNTGTGSRKGGGETRKASGDAGRNRKPAKAEVPASGSDDLPGDWDELDTEARVLFLVNERGYSGSAAGPVAGVSDARGRQIVRMAKGLSATAPQDVIGETAQEGKTS